MLDYPQENMGVYYAEAINPLYKTMIKGVQNKLHYTVNRQIPYYNQANCPILKMASLYSIKL